VRRAQLDRLFGIDLRALAIYRIAIALILLFDLATRLPFVADFYTDGGLLPRHLTPFNPQGSPTSLHTLSGALGLQLAFFAVGIAAAVLLALGLWTSLAKTVSYLNLLSLWWRNQGVLNAGDLFLVTQLFWCLFLPLGARYSLDARRGEGAPPGARRVLSVASAGALLNLAYLYFFSVFHKLGGAGWLEGTAVFYAVSHETWQRSLGELITHLPAWIPLLTWSVLAFEFVGPLMFFSPWKTTLLRSLSMLGFAGMQLGLGTSIRLWLFPWAMTIALIPFTPTPVVDWLEARLGRGPRLPGEAARPEPAPPLGLARLPNVLAAIGLLYITFSHVERAIPSLPAPPLLTRVGRIFALNQGPAMYAVQRFYDAELQVRGVLVSGETQTIDDGGATASWPPVARLRTFYRGQTYLERLEEQRLRPELQAFGEWVCRVWKAEGPARPALREVQVVGVRRTIPLYDVGMPETHSGVLRRVQCAAIRSPE